uniref:CHK kinase-like domain-containing protein n=1 Tax=Panagrolaimus sp. PS1159 TaxID=55785 RepID=A0AC35FQ64_9BILA
MIEDLVDHNQSINGHSITVGWLLDSLRKNDKEFQRKHGGRKVKEILIDEVSNGNGIISNIFRCTLSFTDSIDPKDIYTTILKIPGTGVFMKTISDNEMTAEMTKDIAKQFVEAHSAECNFYNNLAQIFDVPIPKVYQTLEWIIGKHDGCIHMEDLTKKGKVLAFYEDINLTQIKNVIKHLAHMHKNVLEMDSKIWEGKYPSNPDGLNHFLDMLIPTIDAFKEKCRRKGLLFKTKIEIFRKNISEKRITSGTKIGAYISDILIIAKTFIRTV